MSQSQGKPTDREKLDSLGRDPLAQSIKSAPATPLDVERHRSTADAESSAQVDNVKQLKDPDLFRHDFSTSDTCNSKTQDSDDSSSSSIPTNPSVTGVSAGALSTNLRHGTNRPGNQASPVDTKLSTESQGRDEGVQSADAPLIAAEREKKEPGMKGKAVSAAGEVDIGSPPPPLLVIESASSTVSSPLSAVQSPPTSMPAPQVKEQKMEERPPIRHSPSLASISSYPWTSASTMSLASLSRVQSGRSYLSENPPQKKVKVKTRPELPGLQRVEEPSTKKSFLARLGFKKDVAPRTQEETKAWLRGVSSKNAGFLAQILGADKSAMDGGLPMKWDDFVNVLIDLGFQVVAKKRSKVRFKPPYQGLPKSTFPKPRSGNTIDPNTLQKCGKKLKDRYGWSEELIPEHAN